MFLIRANEDGERLESYVNCELFQIRYEFSVACLKAILRRYVCKNVISMFIFWVADL